MDNLLNSNDMREFLNRLEDEDVTKLAITTTQKLIKPEEIKDKEEAIDLIIRHSSDAQTVLNRRVITREILFQYLNEKGISRPESATKLSLINKILQFWDTNNEKQVATTQSSNSVLNNNVNEMAIKFTEWFYKILNENEPIGEEHFFQDCILKLNLISDSNSVSECVENNPEEIGNLLFRTKCEHGLFFNPNLNSEGIKGKLDNHGLVMIFVCGTLHTKESIVGIFEQMFALARDPFSDNNWKIKNTLLNLKSKAVNNVPVLEDSTLNYQVALKDN